MSGGRPYRPLDPDEMEVGAHYAFCTALSRDGERVTVWTRGVFAGRDEWDEDFVLVVPRFHNGDPQSWRSHPDKPVHKHWTRTLATWKDWERAGFNLAELKKITKARRKKKKETTKT